MYFAGYSIMFADVERSLSSQLVTNLASNKIITITSCKQPLLTGVISCILMVNKSAKINQ